MTKERDWTKVGTKARKFTAALVGAVAMIVATGLVPEEFVIYANAAIGFATALGVYKVENVD